MANQDDILIRGAVEWENQPQTELKAIYGEIWTLANDVATDIVGAGTFVQFISFEENGSQNGVIADKNQNHLTIVTEGNYTCVCSFHVESVGGGAADTVSMEIRKNNGTVAYENLHAHRKLAGGGGDIGSISISGMLPDLEPDDTIELWLTNDDNATDILVADANIYIERKGVGIPISSSSSSTSASSTSFSSSSSTSISASSTSLSSSSSSLSSSSSACAGQTCPGDCTDCDDAYTVTVDITNPDTGCFVGAFCGALEDDNPYVLSKAGGDCTWVEGASTLSCSSEVWTLHIQNGPDFCAVEWTAPNCDGCPPITGWELVAGTCEGTVVVSSA